jgi:uncharacterized protein DUF7025
MIFHIREELKLQRKHRGISVDTIEATHLSLFVDFVDTTFQPITEHLSTLLAKKEITYDLLWALFEPNMEVYTTCRGTGASRCVLFNHCEERKEMDGSKYMYLEIRSLSCDGKILGEATTGIKIPYFLGTKQIEHLPGYPLRYHPEKDKVRTELIQCGRTFVSLIGIHHRQYEGKAFFIDDEGDVISRHIKGRIMVDAICFQERMPNYECPRVRTARPYSEYMSLWQQYAGPTRLCGSITNLANINLSEAEETELLICSPTVFGFCLSSKQFCSWLSPPCIIFY